MARRISNIDPINLQSRTAVGVSLPLNGPAGGFNNTYTTDEQLKTNLIAYLLTNRGERVFQPNFGADLRKVIFEQLEFGTLEELKETLTLKISNEFPRVRIIEMNVTPDEDTNSIDIFFSYRVTNTNIQNTISINVG